MIRRVLLFIFMLSLAGGLLTGCGDDHRFRVHRRLRLQLNMRCRWRPCR